MSSQWAPIAERLWSRVAPPNERGCLLWTGSQNGTGYGYIWWNGRNRLTHRVAWELANGPVPDGLELDHLCRMRACINVGHLEPVTHSENIRRAPLLGANHLKTHCPKGHAYTEENTYRYQGRTNERRCKVCKRAAMYRSREKLRAVALKEGK